MSALQLPATQPTIVCNCLGLCRSDKGLQASAKQVKDSIASALQRAFEGEQAAAAGHYFPCKEPTECHDHADHSAECCLLKNSPWSWTLPGSCYCRTAGRLNCCYQLLKCSCLRTGHQVDHAARLFVHRVLYKINRSAFFW